MRQNQNLLKDKQIEVTVKIFRYFKKNKEKMAQAQRAKNHGTQFKLQTKYNSSQTPIVSAYFNLILQYISTDLSNKDRCLVGCSANWSSS